MTRFAPLSVALFLLLPAAASASGQHAPAPAVASGSPQATLPAQSASETREALERTLEQYGPALPRILKLDPTLLANDAYLQPYPALRSFLSEHPDVARNASYYFAQYSTGIGSDYDSRLPRDRAYETWNTVLDGFAAMFFFSASFAGVVWLIRTAINHRRWIRVSKVQADVHTKLLDRFSTNEELLAYIQTPAGKRFLESAPIPVESPRAISAPFGRILWSMQIGSILTVAGIGIEIVAARAIEDVSQPLAGIGVVVIALGVGFLVSSALAYMMSRRLGLLATVDATTEARG